VCEILAERQHSSIYTTAETILRAFSDPRVLEASSRANYTRRAVGRRVKHALPLRISARAGSARLRSFFASMLDEVVGEVQQRSSLTGAPIDPPLLVVNDEAANSAPMPGYDVVAATGAGQGILTVAVAIGIARLISGGTESHSPRLAPPRRSAAAPSHRDRGGFQRRCRAPRVRGPAEEAAICEQGSRWAAIVGRQELRPWWSNRNLPRRNTSRNPSPNTCPNPPPRLSPNHRRLLHPPPPHLRSSSGCRRRTSSEARAGRRVNPRFAGLTDSRSRSIRSSVASAAQFW
jgi:hypothetical protein